MTKQLTSAEAAAIVYGSPGTKVLNNCGEEVWVSEEGSLVSISEHNWNGGALRPSRAPFTIPADPELPEDVRRELPGPVGNFVEKYEVLRAFEALWKHIKPEAKR